MYTERVVEKTRTGTTVLPLFAVAIAFALPLPALAMRVAAGSYTGNGSDNRSITGLGFAPSVVLVKAAAPVDGVLRLSTMTGDESAPLDDTAYASNAIQALESDGFQVGTASAVNTAGTTYYWFAVEHAAGESTALRYTGNGADNRSITGVSYPPDVVFVKGNGGKKAYARSSALTGDTSIPLVSSGVTSDIIQALESTGFQVGTDQGANKADRTYDAWVLRAAAGTLSVGSYTGDGTDSRSIAGVGFAPEVVLVKRDGGSAGAFRTTAHAGDLTSALAGPTLANALQALESDGFQLGTDATVNQSENTYYWFAWKSQPPDTTPPSPPTASPAGGSYTSAQTVTLSTETGATIRYTTDETDPTGTSTAYSSALTISATTTLKATATDYAGNVSSVRTETYTISSPAPPPPPPSSDGDDGSAPATPPRKVTKTASTVPPPPPPAPPPEPPPPTPTPTAPVTAVPLALAPVATPPPTPLPPLPTPTSVTAPAAATGRGAPPPPATGRVAAAFAANVLRIAPVAEAAPPELQRAWRLFRVVDTALLAGFAGGFGLALFAASSALTLVAQRVTVRHAWHLVPLRPLRDYGARFALAAPQDETSGVISIPFSHWKGLLQLKDRCLYTLVAITSGKVALAGLAVTTLGEWLTHAG